MDRPRILLKTTCKIGFGISGLNKTHRVAPYSFNDEEFNHTGSFPCLDDSSAYRIAPITKMVNTQSYYVAFISVVFLPGTAVSYLHVVQTLIRSQLASNDRIACIGIFELA
jgi:hypothetical protein